ncbi:MAG TPA: DinB family protein [Vicinamibacteria bacterium]|nr:DinB family protein [Vicinamibacteria bacterium]
MLRKDDLGRLLDYTVWANHRVLRAAATLSVADFKRDLGSSHGGIRGTLTHALSAEWLWLERWKGVSPRQMMDEGEFGDVVALRDRWAAIDQHRASWFKSLRAKEIAAEIRYRNLEGREFEAPLWQSVQHVTNHSTYHRGQVVTLLRLLKAKPPATDLVLWDRERAARAARRD